MKKEKIVDIIILITMIICSVIACRKRKIRRSDIESDFDRIKDHAVKNGRFIQSDCEQDVFYVDARISNVSYYSDKKGVKKREYQFEGVKCFTITADVNDLPYTIGDVLHLKISIFRDHIEVGSA